MIEDMYPGILMVAKHEFQTFPKKEAIQWTIQYILFLLFHKLQLHTARPFRSLACWEARVSSQNGEDGILQHILALIGSTNKYFVEFGVENGTECNTALLRSQGWNGVWMDNSYNNQFVKKEHITQENIESLFKKYHVPKNFDVLSIDIDSNDYWIWKAIRQYQPRIVVIEYNANIPPNESKTIPYTPSFIPDGTDFYGASLLALEKLGKQKGYVLIGCDSRGINAFFVHHSVWNKYLPIGDTQLFYKPPQFGKSQGYTRSAKHFREV